MRQAESFGCARSAGASGYGKALAAGRANLRLAAGPAAALLARLLIVGDALDVLGKAFLLTGLLKPPQQLLRGLVAATLDLDHRGNRSFLRNLANVLSC